MVSVAVSEFILIVAVVIVGLLLFSFIEAYVVPQYVFTIAEQQARALSSASFISVSPPDIGTSGYSFVVYPYIAGFKGNVSLFIFEEPASLVSSIGVLTPQSSTPNFSAYYPNGTSISKVTIGPIYDTNGNELVTSLTAYTVPANTPIVITGTIPKNYVVIIWVIYNAGSYYSKNYYFRITYTYISG